MAVRKPEMGALVIDPTAPPVGTVPDEAPTDGGLTWLQKFEADHPGTFRQYWELVLHEACDEPANARAAEDWSPLAYRLDGVRLLPYQWRLFRGQHGMKGRRRGKNRRRGGVPVEVLADLRTYRREPIRELPPDGWLCPACGTLALRLTEEEMSHVWLYRMRQGRLPLEGGG